MKFVTGLIRIMRSYQWVKNLLVFVPIFTSLTVRSPPVWRSAGLAFLAFCLVASGGYVVNDIKDAPRDRLHPTKKRRPLAAGAISARAAAVLAFVLAATGVAIAARVNAATAVLVALYLATTLAYTFWIKNYVLADVLALAALYTLRIVTGTAAIDQPNSLWLLSFSMFLFFSLALVKRHTELHPEQRADGRRFGRDYALTDLAVVVSLGVCSALFAAFVMALYVDSAVAAARYASPHWLWLVCPIIWYWCGRLWFKAARREIDEDPIVYALRDRASWVCLAAIACLWAAAVLGAPGPLS